MRWWNIKFLKYFWNIYNRGQKPPNILRVLTYHRVDDPNSSPYFDPRLISATPGEFDKQMNYLSRYYSVISMETVLNTIARKDRLPKRAVLITFDDAYYDVKENAWPILKKYRLPATVFVPTSFPDQPETTFWWDRLYYAFIHSSKKRNFSSPIGNLPAETIDDRRQSLRKLQSYLKKLDHAEAMSVVNEIDDQSGVRSNHHRAVLNWDELRALWKDGLNLGAHTQTHPILTRIPLQKVHEEVLGSLQDLQREIGNVLPVFAYPNGNYNAKIMHILHDVGFKLAFSTEDGFNNLNKANYLSLRRMNITRRTTLRIFQLRLFKWFSLIDVLRHSN